jgi:hypothetical protein
MNIHFIDGKNEKGESLYYFATFLSILSGGVID